MIKTRIYNLTRATIELTHLGQTESRENILSDLMTGKSAIKNTTLGPIKKEKIKRDIQILRKMLKINKLEIYEITIHLKKYRSTHHETIQIGCNPDDNFKFSIKQSIDNAIRAYRETNRLQLNEHFYPNIKMIASVIGSNKVGIVFDTPGQIMKFYIEKNLKDLYKEKKPIETIKYVGLELEFCAPIKEQDFALKLFRAGVHTFVQLKEDRSLRPKEGENGFELAILMKETSYQKDLKKVMGILTEVGAIAEDRRCGLHVHLDMRQRNKDVVYHNFISCQDLLLSLVDPKRYNNEFCRRVKSKKFPTKFTGERQERYKTINAAAFYKYKTLEVRMHEGSVNYVDICNWMNLLIRIGSYKKKIAKRISKLTILKKRFNINKKMYNHLLDKKCYWQINGDRHPTDVRTGSIAFDLVPVTSVPSIDIESTSDLRIYNDITSNYSITYAGGGSSGQPSGGN